MLICLVKFGFEPCPFILTPFDIKHFLDLYIIYQKCPIMHVAQDTLTLRQLMFYIYIYMEHLFLMFLDHTQRRSTVGRTPLDE